MQSHTEGDCTDPEMVDAPEDQCEVRSRPPSDVYVPVIKMVMSKRSDITPCLLYLYFSKSITIHEKRQGVSSFSHYQECTLRVMCVLCLPSWAIGML